MSNYVPLLDDDLMDFLQDGSWTIKVIARHFGRTEHHMRTRLNKLISKGLVEPERKPSGGVMGASQIRYRLTRTKRAA